MRTVEVRANSWPQRTLIRSVASDKAKANTAKNAIAAALNTVNQTVNPVGGTTRSASGAPDKKAQMYFKGPPPPVEQTNP